MNWLFIAVIAQTIFGTSNIFDKLFLNRSVPDPFVFTFWLGMLELFGLALVPFGFVAIPLHVILVALLSGAVFIVSLFFLYSALSRGGAFDTLLVNGIFYALATLAFSAGFLHNTFAFSDWVGFLLLLSGSVVFFFAEPKTFRLAPNLFIFVSACLMALSTVLGKIVFLQSPFITGFVWIKTGGFLFTLLFLLAPSLRRRIMEMTLDLKISNRMLYLANRAYAGLGTVLVDYAISLGPPALVTSVEGYKFVVIFVAGWFLLGERFYGKALVGKIIATILVVAGLAWLALGDYAGSLPVNEHRPIQWGVTFSEKFSKDLSLDWQKNFLAIADELHPQKIRLIAYWDLIENNRGAFDFADLDWQIAEAAKRNISVVLVVGMKVPRWPECHNPQWANALATEDRESALRDYMKIVVEHYRMNPAIIMWQVENEPYLMFGNCTARGNNFLEKEIVLVKLLDATRPVLVTDGGEFGLWNRAARAGDVFGTTMYRRVYPKFIGSIFGVIEYPLSPSYFRLKEKFVRWVIGDAQKKFIVVELQAEPWEPVSLSQVSYEEQIKNFNRDYFVKTIAYAKETGFNEYYLWGSEWWYWLKEKHNDSSMWGEAKNILEFKN
ncbi:DMT family transporter [Patescibacteria group bacterium]|nr:DMT family transporter [Patescibacteria group bacterium]